MTYRRDLRIDEAWEQIGADFNRWITHMRKDFGKIDVVRCWEAQEEGYPHIHCILVFRKRNDVLSLALMWIFKKRAFSVSKDFGDCLVEEKNDLPYGQVDLNGESIYSWYLIGFWADINCEFGLWSVDLSYNGFWRIRTSKEFTLNKY